MKKTIYFFCSFTLLLLYSFGTNLDCEYASSNMGFAKSQIKEALLTNDISQARFYSYKALNAMEKSKSQLKECGCKLARNSMNESLDLLILATKSTTLEGTKSYLSKSLELTENTMFVLEAHDAHDSSYSNDMLAMNSKNSSDNKATSNETISLSLSDKIDISLEKYRISLNQVVLTVNCKEAKAFAKRIYEECETQLLKPNLSEGKKYYNLRTKEITLAALKEIGDCTQEIH
ncbi:hypothetical protein ACNR9Q_08365 [Maribacter sp. X9]|uniref:hypothetical protein n=1 Tax=Maribacter sp. X9 TaxID=3402159 RepID=UPI003AF40384